MASNFFSGIAVEKRINGWYLIAVCDNESYALGPLEEPEALRMGREVSRLAMDFATAMDRNGAPKARYTGAALRVVLEEIGVPLKPPPPATLADYTTARRYWEAFDARDAQGAGHKVQA